jgi:hypothetical protein
MVIWHHLYDMWSRPRTLTNLQSPSHSTGMPEHVKKVGNWFLHGTWNCVEEHVILTCVEEVQAQRVLKTWFRVVPTCQRDQDECLNLWVWLCASCSPRDQANEENATTPTHRNTGERETWEWEMGGSKICGQCNWHKVGGKRKEALLPLPIWMEPLFSLGRFKVEHCRCHISHWSHYINIFLISGVTRLWQIPTF